jgi:hypothetical protein
MTSPAVTDRFCSLIKAGMQPRDFLSLLRRDVLKLYRVSRLRRLTGANIYGPILE